MMTNDRIIVIAGAVIMVALQILIAPHVAIGRIVPNFITAFVMVTAILRARTFGPVMPFLMGLVFDLLSGGPVGAMAFSLTLFSTLAASAFVRIDNDTLFMPLITLVVGILLVNLSYGVFLLLFGYNAGFVEAFAYRIVPCFVFDTVIALLVYVVFARLIKPSGPMNPSIARLR
jgi:rod shape-determining protein MreD